MRIFLNRQLTDQYNCVRVELSIDPGGHAYDRTEYLVGSLYFREPDYGRFVNAMEKQFDVSERVVPSYEQIQGTERS